MSLGQGGRGGVAGGEMNGTQRRGVGQAGSSIQRGSLLLLKGVWDPAQRSKANKQARLVERKFILDASNWWGRGEDIFPKANSPPHPLPPGNQWGKSFYGQNWGGGYMPSEHGQL